MKEDMYVDLFEHLDALKNTFNDIKHLKSTCDDIKKLIEKNEFSYAEKEIHHLRRTIFHSLDSCYGLLHFVNVASMFKATSPVISFRRDFMKLIKESEDGFQENMKFMNVSFEQIRKALQNNDIAKVIDHLEDIGVSVSRMHFDNAIDLNSFIYLQRHYTKR